MADRTPEALAQMRRTLEAVRREIAATVASTPWQANRQTRLLAEIDAHLAAFEREARQMLREPLAAQFGEGQSAIDAQLVGRGVMVGNFPALSVSGISAMQHDLGTRITHLTTDARMEIQRVLQVGLLGGKTPFETMADIGRNLDGGRFKLVAQRAETIVREEFGRTFRKAAQLRMAEAARRVMGLKKQWVHAGHPAVPRPTHLALHGTILPVDARFDLVNIKTGEVERPLHPKDPILSPENSIGCGCVARPWKETWNLSLPDLPAVA